MAGTQDFIESSRLNQPAEVAFLVDSGRGPGDCHHATKSEIEVACTGGNPATIRLAACACGARMIAARRPARQSWLPWREWRPCWQDRRTRRGRALIRSP